jgi:hypothetical protein
LFFQTHTKHRPRAIPGRARTVKLRLTRKEVMELRERRGES